jgi:hypothetical protein
MKTFLNTLQGKIIAGLTIIALVMGILVEGIQIQTAYYTMIVRKTESIQANSVLRNAHGL